MTRFNFAIRLPSWNFFLILYLMQNSNYIFFHKHERVSSAKSRQIKLFYKSLKPKKLSYVLLCLFVRSLRQQKFRQLDRLFRHIFEIRGNFCPSTKRKMYFFTKMVLFKGIFGYPAAQKIVAMTFPFSSFYSRTIFQPLNIRYKVRSLVRETGHHLTFPFYNLSGKVL